MAGKSGHVKRTGRQIKEHIREINKAIEMQRGESKGEYFTSVTPEEIKNKLKRVNSPMIISQAWNSTTPGGTVNYDLGIYNPDPQEAIWLFAHVWVGSGNVDPTVGSFLLGVDARFPRLTQPGPYGLTLATGASATLSFGLEVPSPVEKTNYLGNSCLMRVGWHDVGTYLDRGLFAFAVS